MLPKDYLSNVYGAPHTASGWSPTRRDVVKLMGAGAAASLIGSSRAFAQSADGKQPNIVMVVIDDAGFSDIGAYGSEIKTPHIDELATGGLRYNRFDTCAICSPTRAALMTGRNPQTVNMDDLPGKGEAPPIDSLNAHSGELPLNAETVAAALQKTGYATFALGKWHLCPTYSDDDARNRLSWPRQRGFDYFYGFLSGHTDQYHPDLVENNTVLPTPDNPDYHLSVDLVDHAIDAMQPDKTDKPKFVYLALGATHSPYHVPEAYIDAYRGAYDKGWDEIRKARFARQKDIGIIPDNTVLPPREVGDAAWDTLDDQHKRVFARFMETYAGFMTHTDEQIGRLVDYLKETGQYDNTLIMLITDNGAASEGGANGGFFTPYLDKTTVAEMDAHLDEAGSPSTYMLYPRPWAYAGDTPFRRYKLWPYAGGVRTPMIVSWPDHIEDAGAVRSQYVNVIDLAPTILAVAGGGFSASVDGVEQLPVAGKSVLETFTSSDAATRSVQFFTMRGNRAITDGDWRAVAMHRIDTDFDEDPWQLFNVAEDFSESHDLSQENPEKLEAMKALWWEEAKKYANPPLADPVELLYNLNGFGDAFENIGD
ncbi:arylsulfatase [Martelella mangrovi]|uniref:Arylsulfatase n=1 Tax=Martelella mangrovi TaxID=1397477 RepID=A0ABV2ID10_9HYPH